jgi:DDB1- and CUL4-associated factor 8
MTKNIYLFPKNGGLGPDPKLSVKGGSNKGSKSTEVASGQGGDEPAAPQAYIGHRNHETVKRVSFMRPNDEYVTSGSDCGRIFIWRKRDGKLLRAMEGDECIENCIEPHPHSMMIANSGIDNDVKIWTPSAIERAPIINVDEVIISMPSTPDHPFFQSIFNSLSWMSFLPSYMYDVGTR